MSFKLKSTNLNPFQSAYDFLKNTPYFNKYDWEEALKRGDTELTQYIGQISQYDKLPSLDILEKEYSWSDMDYDRRSLLMFALNGADNSEKKNYSIVTGYDDKGNEIKQDFEFTEKEYYEHVLKEWSDYNKEVIGFRLKEQSKHNAAIWQKLWYGMKTGYALLGEAGIGALNAVENVVNLFDAVIASFGSIFEKSDDPAMIHFAETFRESLSDDDMINLFGLTLPEVTDDWYQSFLRHEYDIDTYMFKANGERTSFGRTAGGIAYSMGQMIPSILLANVAGAAGASSKLVSLIGQGTFYGSMFETALQERFKDDDFDSVSTGLIVGEAALKTGLDYLSAFAVGKLFNGFSNIAGRRVTKMDAMRGVLGATNKSSGIKTLLVDAAQEASEETLQEFTSWLSTSTFSLMNDKFKTDIDYQQFVDAAISGAISSFIIGGFGTIKRSVSLNRAYKKIANKNVNYKQLSKQDKRTFRKNLHKFSEARSKLTEISEYTSTLDNSGLVQNASVYGDTIVNRNFGLGAIAKTYMETKNEIDATTEEGRAAIAELNLQMYDSYKVMMELYGTLGLERAKAAETLLNELNNISSEKKAKFTTHQNKQGEIYHKYADAGNIEYLKESKRITRSWNEKINTLVEDDAKRKALIKDIKVAEKETKKKVARKKSETDTKPDTDKNVDEKVVEKEDEGIESDVKALFDEKTGQVKYTDDVDNTDDDKTKEEVLKTATELSKIYGHELVVWDNHEIIELNGKLFAPTEAVVNLSSKELIKASAERSIVKQFKDNLPNDLKKLLKKAFRTYFQLEDEAEIDSKYIWATLYDEGFYWYLLNSSDKRSVDILKTLDNLAAIASSKASGKTMVREYELAIRRVRNNIGPRLALYFCNNHYMTFENVTVFDDATISYIERHRYNPLMAEKLITLDENDAEFKRYKNVIINRINSLPISKENKAKYIKMFDNGVLGRHAVIQALDNLTKDNYFGGYDNKKYKKGDDALTHRLNAFLYVYDLTYEDLRNASITSNPTMYKLLIDELGNNYNDDDVRNWFNALFINFTKGDYSLKFGEGVSVNADDSEKLKLRISKYLGGKSRPYKQADFEFLVDTFKKYGITELGFDEQLNYLLKNKKYDEYVKVYLTALDLELLPEGFKIKPISNVDVVPLKKYVSKINADYLKTKRSATVSKFVDPVEINLDVINVLSPLLKFANDFESAYITVNDVILNPEKYLKPEELDKIRETYNLVNDTTVFSHLKSYLLHETTYEMSIILDDDNRYRPVLFNSAESFLTDEMLAPISDTHALNKYISRTHRTVLTANNLKKYVDLTNDTNRIVVVDAKTGEGVEVYDRENPVNKSELVEYLNSGKYKLFYEKVVAPEKIGRIPISAFIKDSKLIGELKNITVEFVKMSSVRGIYREHENRILVSKDYANDTELENVLYTILHEFQHAIQRRNNLAGGFNTSFKVTKAMINDVLEHVPELRGRKSDSETVRFYIYSTVTGEQLSRGTYLDFPFAESTMVVEEGDGKYIVTAWGTKHKIEYLAKDEDARDVDMSVEYLDEGETKPKRTLKELRADAEKATDYQKRVNDALDLINTNKKKKVKTFKKDLKPFKLSPDVVTSLLNGTYDKRSSRDWVLSKRAITSYERRLTSQKRYNQIKRGRIGEGNRYLTKSEAEGTNLIYFYEALGKKGWRRQIDPSIKNFVLSATDFDRLDKALVEKIQDGSLTLWDINDFIRDKFIDEEGMNDYTFNKLKESFFKNSPFTKFSQIVRFVNKDIVLKGYAIRSALIASKQQELSKVNLLKEGFTLSDFLSPEGRFAKLAEGSFIKDASKRKAYKEAYANAYRKLTTSDIVTDKGKYLKDENLIFEDAKADILLGLTLYFKGSLDDLRYIADNARAQLINSIRKNKAFTYIERKGTGGNKAMSLNFTISGENDGDLTELGELIKDERSKIDEDLGEATAYETIKQFADAYYLRLIEEGEISVEDAKRELYSIYDGLLGFDDEELLNKFALLKVLMNTGLRLNDAFNESFKTLVTSVFDDTTVEIKRSKNDVYGRVYNMINKTISPKLNKLLFNKFVPDDMKQYFDTKRTYRFKVGSMNDLSAEQINELIPRLKEITQNIRIYNSSKKSSKSTAEKQAKTNAKNKRGIDNETKGKRFKINIEEDVNIYADREMPGVLKDILQSSFNKERKSNVKYTYYEDEKYMQTNLRTFLKENAQTLLTLTEADVKDILDFFEHGNVANRDYVPYDVIRIYLIAYFIEQSDKVSRFHFEPELYERLHNLNLHIRSMAGSNLAAVRSTMKMINVEEELFAESFAKFGIDMSGEPELASLVKNINRLNKRLADVDDKAWVNKPDTLAIWREEIQAINQAMHNFEKKALAKFKRGKRVISEDMRKIGVKVKRKNLQQVIELIDNSFINKADAIKILGKTDITSAELKKLRDKHKLTDKDLETIKNLLGEDLYNYLVEKSDIKINKNGTINKTKHELKSLIETMDAYLFASKHYAGDLFNKILKWQKAAMLASIPTVARGKISNYLLGGLNYLSDKIGNMFTGLEGKTEVKQYNFKGVKVSPETTKFVKDYVVDSKLFELIGDGLTRYDPVNSKQTGEIGDLLTDLIVKKVMTNLYGKNTYDHDAINKVVNFVFELHSDERFIEKKAIAYIGKMLEHNKTDLSKGITDKVMNVIAEAYSLASYEYMHRSNFISDWINSLKRTHPQAHVVLSLAHPFIANGWNWFLDLLKMNPVSLAYNIRKLTKLEQYVYKLDESRRTGHFAPSSEFAAMLIKRDIGRGVIGTFVMILGWALSYFGVLAPDIEDDKIKLKIGKSTYVDFSNLHGFSAFLVGAELANPRDGSSTDVFKYAFNQMFDDFALTQVMDSFRYNNSIFDYFTSLPTTIISGFIPNIYKQTIRLTQNHKINYSKGFVGDLQYLAVQVIPFIEYAMPKEINPYTGEWEERYSMPFIHNLHNMISPISIKTYKLSDVELAFIDAGYEIKSLTGEYKELGKLDKELLNEFYGKLNYDTAKKFITNKVKYKVEIEDGKYRELYYSQMNDEQRKSVLTSITNKNANNAKIYVWTNSGHKYYCSSSKRQELMRLGITKNVYIGNKGFVK